MIYETIRLNDDIPDVTLTAYIPAPSSEYQMERKIPAVIVCPGGAFLFLSEREGVAEPFEHRGCLAIFVV